MAQQSTTSTYDNIISGMLPSVKDQQKGMYDYLAQLARRQGTAGAMQQAAKGVAPYAEQVGKAVGQTAPLIAQLKEKERQFNEGQANWQKEFEEKKREFNLQQSMAKEGQDWNQMMTMLQYTGWTPEIMNLLGYGNLKPGDMRGLNNQINQLGFGNPMQSAGKTVVNGTLGQWNNWGGKTGLIYA